MTPSAIIAIIGVTALATSIIYRLIQTASTTEAVTAAAATIANITAGAGVFLCLASILAP